MTQMRPFNQSSHIIRKRPKLKRNNRGSFPSSPELNFLLQIINAKGSMGRVNCRAVPTRYTVSFYIYNPRYMPRVDRPAPGNLQHPQHTHEYPRPRFRPPPGHRLIECTAEQISPSQQTQFGAAMEVTPCNHIPTQNHPESLQHIVGKLAVVDTRHFVIAGL